MKTIVPLVRASHFQPTVAVTAIATALAIQVGRGTGTWWVFLAVLTGQLSVGWSNDYLDRQRDRRSSRIDKPIVAGQVSASLVGACAVVALILCIPLSLFSGWRAGSLHLAAVSLAWAYNFKLKSTFASAVPFLVDFGLLPACVTLGLARHPWPRLWAIVAASLLGVGAHFVNVLPDLESDRHTGVNGLPQRVGYVASLIIGAILIATSTVVIALFAIDSEDRLRIGFLVLSLAGALSIFISGLSGRTRLAWTMTLCLAVVAVASLIANGSSIVGG
ncbi:MAG: UbiA family prenyltransferase, partial [Ilumatobacteraceae bacterium]